MDKPFSLQNLIDRLKSKGMVQVEAAAKIIAGETCDWAAESLAMNSNKYVQFIAPVVAGLKPILLKELDKLDGQVTP